MGTSSNPTSPGASFSRAIPGRLDAIAPLTHALSEWAAAAGVANRVTASMALILEELITNVVTHGYRGAPGELQLLAAIEADRLVVTLRDQAFAFNPLEAPAADTSSPIDERQVGGLGVHLVRSMADELCYRRTESGGRGTNELRIVKHLSPAPG